MLVPSLSVYINAMLSPWPRDNSPAMFPQHILNRHGYLTFAQPNIVRVGEPHRSVPWNRTTVVFGLSEIGAGTRSENGSVAPIPDARSICSPISFTIFPDRGSTPRVMIPLAARSRQI